jgi:hypothetical protein
LNRAASFWRLSLSAGSSSIFSLIVRSLIVQVKILSDKRVVTVLASSTQTGYFRQGKSVFPVFLGIFCQD